MKINFKRLASLAMSLVLVLGVVLGMSAEAHAATISGLSDTGIGLSGSTSYWSANGTAISGSVTGSKVISYYISKSDTLTIKNNKADAAVLSFDFTASGNFAVGSSVTVDGTEYTKATTSHYEKELAAGGSIKIKLAADRCNSSNGANTISIAISNLSLVIPNAGVPTTFQAPDHGSYTVTYGTTTETISAGSAAVEITNDSTVAYTMTVAPGSGYKLVGWYNVTTGAYLSTDTTYKAQFETACTIRPVVVSAATPVFKVGTGYYFDLNEANTAALNGSSKTVILVSDGTLASGNYEISSGVTLLIPFDAANTLYTAEPKTTGTGTYVKPTAYRTLTLDSGANITVNGAISVSGQHMRTAAGQMNGNAPSGPQGFIKTAEGSKITLNNGGKLYAWGFITGSGQVIANSGSEVYELIQIADFRGGSQTTADIHADLKVFPFSQYYVQNIEAELWLYAGAKEYSYTTIYMSSMEFSSSVAFIGPSGCMFNLSDGYVVKRYDGKTDSLILDAYGTVSVNPIEMGVGIGNNGMTGISINSSDFVLPITNNFKVSVYSGSITMNQDLALLPGSELYIGPNATCAVGDGISVYVYDADAWGKYCWGNVSGTQQNVAFCPVVYAPTRTYTRKAADLKDVKITIAGIIDATNGYIYTTEGGANVTGAEGAVVKLTLGTDTITYQLEQNTSGDDDTTKKIPITAPVLINGNGTTVLTKDGGDNTYTYTNSKWVCENHTEEVIPAVDATCTAPGKTAGKKCSVCGEILDEQQTVDALGHKPEADDGDCTTAVICSVCKAVTTAANTNHNYNTSQTDGKHGCKNDGCDQTIACADATADGDHVCDYGCGKELTDCNDTDKNHECDDCQTPMGEHKSNAAYSCLAGKCDYCGADMPATADHQPEADDGDCTTAIKCSVCGTETTAAKTHTDTGKDHACDNAGCTVYQGTHADGNTDHNCDYGCSESIGGHTDGNDEDHLCDYGCGQQADEGCYDADNDGDHKCDECKAENVTTCGDSGKDHTCDTDSACTAYSTGSNAHADGDDKDHLCDYCQGDVGETCYDNDKNHKCDECGEPTSTCVDENPKDHVCDYEGCKAAMGTHADGNDENHLCDYGCGQIADEGCHDAADDGDHKCDECKEENVTTCGDSGKDHICDSDSACAVYSTGTKAHADGNTDHYCDYGCSESIGAHADSATDEDHVCDYCGGEIENGEICGDVLDDEDHNCDVCGQENVTEHEYKAAVTDPTCTEQGYTTYTCNCKHSYVGEYKDPIQHAWSVDYKWEKVEGKWTCTATHICANDAEHNETAAATVNGEQTKAPTCIAMGETTYTAVFTAEWADSQEKTVTDIAEDASNHASEAFEYVINGTGNTDTHTKKHACCKAEVETVQHTYTEGNCVCGDVEQVTVTWTDSEGNVIAEETVDYGHDASTSETVPEVFGYTSTLDTTVEDVTEDQTVAVVLTPKTFGIVWMVGNTEYKTTTITYNTNVVTVEAPEKEGYTFLGWYDGDKLVTNETTYHVENINIAVPATADDEAEIAGTTVLEAKYEIKTYTITWNVDGNVTTETYEHFQIPEFKGSTDKAYDDDYHYDFAGWDADGDGYVDAIAEVAGPVTYTAVYAQKAHTDSAEDNNHVCEYGCDKVLEACADSTEDQDHDCDVCGQKNVTEHEYASVVTDPNCTERGYTTYTCNCTHSYVADQTPALGHRFTDGDDTVCDFCDYERTARIGEVSYATLQDALNKASEGETIVLLKQVVVGNGESAVFKANEGVIITTSVVDAFTATAGGTLTLGENLTVNSNTSILYANGGTIHVKGAVLNTVQSPYAAAFADQNGEINVNSGIISAGGSNAVTLSVSGATANIFGGLVQSKDSSAVLAKNDGVVNISGGKVETTCESDDYFCAAFARNGGKVIVTGGDVTAANGYGLVAVTGGSVSVQGGTVNGVLAHENANASAEISGGTITGHAGTKNGASLTVTGGTFVNDVTEYCVDGCHTVDTDNDGTYTYGEHEFSAEWTTDETNHWHECACGAKSQKAGHQYDDDFDSECNICEYERAAKTLVAMIGGQKFDSVQGAIDAAEEGDTVILQKDVTLTEKLVIEADRQITLDLNGKTLTTSAVDGNYDIVVKGDLTLRNGNIVVSGVYGIGVTGKLTVESGSYSVAGSNDYLIGSWGEVVISGGEFKGQYCCVNSFSGTVSITGGKFTTDKYDASGEYESAVIFADGAVSVSGGSFSNDVTAYCVNGFHTLDADNDGMFTYDEHLFSTDWTADSENHWYECACGAKAEKAAHDYGDAFDVDCNTCDYERVDALPLIAMIGEQKFDSLPAAIEAAQDGDTIVLKQDTMGAGAVIDKSITIDFNGKTYTVNSAVGSTGTETLGLQILVGNTVTLKNGTLTANGDLNVQGKATKVLVMNYADLTVEDMNLVGNENTLYALSNNSGTVYINGATNIDAKNGVAFDVCKYASYEAPVVYVNTTGKMIGRIEVSESIAENLNISGGTFTAEILQAWCAEGFEPKANNDGTYGVKLHYVAAIDGVQYRTLEAAVAAAESGDTIVLLGNDTGAGTVINKSITIDFDGHTYTVNSPVGSSGTETLGFQILAGNTVTVKNGTLTANEEMNEQGKLTKVLIQNYANLTVADMKLIGNENTLYALSNNSGEVHITGKTVIDPKNGVAFDVYKYGSYAEPVVTVEDTVIINGKIEAAARIGNVYYATLTNAVASAEAGETVTLLADAVGAGMVIDKDISIDFGGYTYSFNEGVGSSGTPSNGFQILQGSNVTLRNGALKVAEGSADRFYILVQNYANLTVTDMMLDGTNLDKWSLTDGDSYTLSNNSGTVNITGNTTIIANDDGDKAFAFDVCKYTSYAEPVVTVEDTVTINGKIEAAARIGNVYYATLTNAVASAEAGETVTLLADAIGAGMVIDKSITIDFNSKTYTVNSAVGSSGTETLGMQILTGNTVALKNGTLTANGGQNAQGKVTKVLIMNYADLTVADMNLVGNENTLYALSNNSGTVYINGATNIDAKNGVAFDVCKYASYEPPMVYVETTGQILGRIEVTESISENLMISGGTFTVDVTEYCMEGYHTVDDDSDGFYTYGAHSVVTDEAKDPSCTDTGLTEGSHCDGCGKTLVAQKVIDALGHKEGEAVIENNVEPDFEKDGSYDTVIYCTTCQSQLSRITTVVPAKIAVAVIGENKYETLAAAIAAAAQGETVTLKMDVTLTEKLVVDADKQMTLDLNGKILTTYAVNDNYDMVVKGGLTLMNGNIVVSGMRGIGVTGKLTVESGSYSVAGDNDYLIGNWGEVVINGGEFTGQYCCVNNFAGTTSINGGTFTTAEYDATGEYESADVFADSGLTISGGSFSKEVAVEYLAEGCCAPDVNGSYVVAKHIYQSAVTEPDCENGGYTTYTCSRCGDSYTGDEVDALGHTHSSYGADADEHWSVCSCGETIEGTASAHEYDGEGKCVCGDVCVKAVAIHEDIAYSVYGQTITVTFDKPCRVGYWDEEKQKPIALTAVENADGSYSFTAPDDVTEVLIVITGDINNDGKITGSDVARMNAHLNKNQMNSEELFAADVNGDGEVNEDDRTYLSNAILGKGDFSLVWEIAAVEE